VLKEERRDDGWRDSYPVHQQGGGSKGQRFVVRAMPKANLRPQWTQGARLGQKLWLLVLGRA
jgi:hypothetical protein